MSDKFHYGEGRGAFFYSLVSALGMLHLGGVFAIYHGIHQMMSSGHQVEHGLLSASVLGFSFIVDSYVLTRAIADVKKEKPSNVSLFRFLKTHNDPVRKKVGFFQFLFQPRYHSS